MEASGDSVQMKVQDAVGQAGKFLGNIIGQAPVVKKGPVDEWLKDGGDNLLKDTNAPISMRNGNLSTGGNISIG